MIYLLYMRIADFISPFFRRYSFLVLPIVFGVVLILPVFATTTDDGGIDIDSATTTTLVVKGEQESVDQTNIQEEESAEDVQEQQEIQEEVVDQELDETNSEETIADEAETSEVSAEEENTNSEQTQEQETQIVTPDVVLSNVSSTPTTIDTEKDISDGIKDKEEGIEEEKDITQEDEEFLTARGEIRLRIGKVEDTQEKMGDVEQEKMSEETFFEEDESESFVPADYIAEPASVARAIKREISLETNPTHSCKADPFSVDISNEGAADAVLTFLGRGGSSYEVEIGELPSGISISIDGVETKYKTISNKTTSLPLTFYSTGDVQTGSFSVSVLYIKDGKSISVCQLNLVNS